MKDWVKVTIARKERTPWIVLVCRNRNIKEEKIVYHRDPHVDPSVGQEPMHSRAFRWEHVRIPLRLLGLDLLFR